jgi:hypothetical protein
MHREETIFKFLKFGLGIIFIAFMASSLPLILLDKLAIAVLGSEIYTYAHHNMFN